MMHWSDEKILYPAVAKKLVSSFLDNPMIPYMFCLLAPRTVCQSSPIMVRSI